MLYRLTYNFYKLYVKKSDNLKTSSVMSEIIKSTMSVSIKNTRKLVIKKDDMTKEMKMFFLKHPDCFEIHTQTIED